MRRREEVINTTLALLIAKLGIGAEPESIDPEGRPDVIFSYRGLRVVIEGKFEDVPNAQEVVLDDACNRINKGIAHIAIGAVYPKKLRSTPFATLLDTLAATPLQFQILSEAGETPWLSGTPEALLAAMRRAQEALVQDDIVEKAAESLSQRLDGIARIWAGDSVACDRLSSCLGISIPKKESAESARGRRETAAKVSSLILANALIFQEQLRNVEGVGSEIAGVTELENSENPSKVARTQWRWIWKNVDYVPIFQLAEQVLEVLPVNRITNVAFRTLLSSVTDLCANQAALRHDLMGRIYHWLLHDAKYYGTYYTSGSAATLLLSLAMRAEWAHDFGDAKACGNFRIADLACGTGTLLMASTQALSDRYIRDRAKSGRSLNDEDLGSLHRALIENVLHGYDVLPAAVHLTASTLAMMSPSAAFKKMNLNVMPLGLDVGIARLGSLDFLDDARVETQIALDNTQKENKRVDMKGAHSENASVPKLDLCVMNPPFVRSVGGNLLFGSIENKVERKKLQDELKRRSKNIKASATAGLGSVFVALADKYLKESGRLAFVLPAALTSGEAWSHTRELISEGYHLEVVVSSFDPERANFSENTSLSEVLFVARKLTAAEQLKIKKEKGKQQYQTKYVNLWRNPRSIHEALDIAERIAALGVGSGTIESQEHKYGEVFFLNSPKGKGIWLGAMFAQEKAVRSLLELESGNLTIPGIDGPFVIPMTTLGQLGGLGYDRRDITDAFELRSKNKGDFAAFWGHESSEVKTISQDPNASLDALTIARPNRNLKNANTVWQKSGDILLAERIRTNTHKVLGVHLNEDVLGNTWWAFKSKLNVKQKKALSLWINSTPSILLFLGRKVVTEGAFMQMKKPAWKSMPVLDVKSLTAKQLDSLATAYDRLGKLELKALSLLAKDPARQEIDDAISASLSAPGLGIMRNLISREPSLAPKVKLVKGGTKKTSHETNEDGSSIEPKAGVV